MFESGLVLMAFVVVAMLFPKGSSNTVRTRTTHTPSLLLHILYFRSWKALFSLSRRLNLSPNVSQEAEGFAWAIGFAQMREYMERERRRRRTVLRLRTMTAL